MSKGFVGKILLMLVGFAGSIVFARVLGPVGYGAFHVVVALTNVLDNPISGLGTACKKRISEHGQDAGAILTIGLAVTAGMGLLVGGLLLVVGPHFNYFDIENGPLYVTVAFFGIIFFKVLQPMVAGQGQFGTAVFLDSMRSFFTIPIQLVLIFLGWGIAGMVYGLTAASLLTVPITLYVLGVRPAMPDREAIRSIWEYAKFSVPSNFIGTAYGKVDILLLGAILGSGASGQYKIAMQLVLPGASLSMVMRSGLFTEVSSQSSRGEGIAQQVTNNVAFASVLAIPLFFGALAMPESIVVTIFGSEYRAAAPLLVGLAAYQILQTQSSQISSVLEGLDRPDLRMYIVAVTLVTNVVLGVILVRNLGTAGIVVATIIAEALKFSWMTYLARQHVKYEIFPTPVRYQFVAAIGMFVIVELLHRWWGVRSWFDLLAIVGAGAAIYAVVLILLSEIFMHTAKSILADAREQYR
ncbi:oligosaccharide flippase family protein [Halorussus sp. JP-T4]|uniref:oligosaccharide flippase family protein n=1 Tax=Halorussus sp. JP-T4 TaxID=2716718 RepID=UPI001404D8E1|nr:oligosaccharide flippase family protein [Halorussus sp. JP-T4]